LDDLQSRIQLKKEEQANIELKIKELEPAYETAYAELKECEKETAEIQTKIDDLNNQKDSKTEVYELGMVKHYINFINQLADLTNLINVFLLEFME